MAQHLKDEVREGILSAALEVFAATAYRDAAIVAIARRARVSTGNVYRYFPNKETLFRAVLPPSFPARLLTLLRRRVGSLDGVADVAQLRAGSPFDLVSEQLLDFSIANRLRVGILLGRAEGTPYAGFPQRLVLDLSRLAVRHYRGLGADVRLTPALRATLERIYRNWTSAMVEALVESADEQVIRQRVALFSRYHLAGLNALFREQA